jgi:hypothetical protein
VLPASIVPVTEFSEVRAKMHTRHLVEQIGMRLVGSDQNDVQSVRYLIDAIGRIKTHPDGPKIQVSVQRTTGSLNMQWLHSPITSIFSNVVNVVARVVPRDFNSENLVRSRANQTWINPPAGILVDRASYPHDIEYIDTKQSDNDVKSEVSIGYKERHQEFQQQKHRTSLLLSSHYDSTIGSPGACDDGVPVGVMLEIIRALSASSKSTPSSPRVPVVFNFNGGEEPGMQASFGFIAQHPWAKSVRAVINLEACGCGGKELLFQTGPGNGWLIDAYARSVKHPFASVSAQDLFQKTHAVPGDTDFIVYRDLGDIPGLDLAFTFNGYVYHTSRDDMRSLDRQIGAVQNMGENALSLVREITTTYLGDAKKMSELDTQSERIFFDFFGFFMVVYSYEFAMQMYVAYAAVIFVVFAIQMRSLTTKILTRSEYGLAFAATTVASALSLALGILASASVAVVVALLLDKKMSWYSNDTFGFLLYAPPAVFAIAAAQRLYKHKLHAIVASFDSGLMTTEQKDTLVGNMTFWNSQLLLCVGMLALTAIRFGSGYLLFMFAFTSFVLRFGAVPICKAVSRALLGKGSSAPIARLVEDSCEIFCIAMSCIGDVYNHRRLYTFAIPIMGRSGTLVEVDILVSILVSGATGLVVILTLLPTMHKFCNLKRLQKVAAVCTIASLAFLVMSQPIAEFVQKISSGSSSLNAIGESVKDPLAPYTYDTPKRIFLQHSHRLDEQGRVAEAYYLGLRFDTSDVVPLFEKLEGVSTARAEPDVIAHDVETYYPFGDFIKFGCAEMNRTNYREVSSRPASPIVPTLEKLSDETQVVESKDGSGGLVAKRSLRMRMNTGGPVCWANLRLEADDVVAWSLTDSLPPQTPKGYFMIRKIGNGSHDFTVEFEKKLQKNENNNNNNKIFEDFDLRMTSACYYMESQFMESIKQRLPEWTDVFPYHTFIREFKF